MYITLITIYSSFGFFDSFFRGKKAAPVEAPPKAEPAAKSEEQIAKDQEIEMLMRQEMLKQKAIQEEEEKKLQS